MILARRIMLAAALAIAAGAAGTGSAFAAEEAATSQPRKADEDRSRRVCRNLVPSGTRLTTRICKTQEEWERAMDKTQEGVLRQQLNEQSGVEQNVPRS